MATVTRFMVQTLRGTVAEEFETAAEAVEVADEVDGDIVEYQRPATAFEAAMLSRNDHFAIAAE